MWDLPGPGLEPVSPALAGGFLITVSRGKSLRWDSLNVQILFTRTMASKDVHILIPIICEYVTFCGRRDFKDVFKVRTLRRGITLDYLAQPDHRGPESQRTFPGRVQREKELYKWKNDQKDAVLLALRMGNEATKQATWVASRSWKRQRNSFSFRASRKKQNSADTLILASESAVELLISNCKICAVLSH